MALDADGMTAIGLAAFVVSAAVAVVVIALLVGIARRGRSSTLVRASG